MSHITIRNNLALRDDIGKRLRWAILASVLANIVMWRAAAAIAKHPPHYDLRPVEVTRVIIDKGRRIEKVVKKEDIKKKVAQIHKAIARRPPPPPKIRQRPVPTPPKQTRVPPPKPQGAHSKVLLAKGPGQATDHTALEGGNAPVGKAIDQQNPGNATANPPEPVKQDVPPPKPPEPPKKVEAPPPPAPEPPKKVEPPAPAPEPVKQPEPVKVEPPKPRGPTKDAEPQDEVKPEIPDDLKHGSYKAFVRVKVEIDSDGSFTPILRTSSGNDEIDRRVLEALKKWKWKPALKDGVPVKSTQLFKFEFEVD